MLSDLRKMSILIFIVSLLESSSMITYKYGKTIYFILYTFKSLLVRHLYDSDPKRAARGLNQGRQELQRVNVGHLKFGSLSVGELLSK